MMRPILACLLLVLGSVTANIAIAADAAPQHEAIYRVREILPPDDPNCVPGLHRITFARRLNEKTQAVGYDLCYVASGNPDFPYVPRGTRAFRWTRASGAERLPNLTENSFETYGRDINNLGTAVGWDFDDTGARAPKWPLGGGVADAIDPSFCSPLEPFVFTLADGINDRGSIAGSGNRLGEDGVCRTRWILTRPTGEEIVAPLTGGGVTSINIHEIVVGSSRNDAVKWSPSMGVVVLASGSLAPPFVAARAWAINDRNQVVGSIDRFDDDFSCVLSAEAKIWSPEGVARALPSLPGATVVGAFGINRQGDVVGYSQFASSCGGLDQTQWRAIVWHNRHAEDLNDLIPRRTAREVQLIIATGINDKGEILARGIDPASQDPCPTIDFDPETGLPVYNPNVMCYSERAFLLTPQD